jgi:hypothetical protein
LKKKDLRRDKRCVLPLVCLRIGEEEFSVRNWSLGGFLLDGAPDIPVGGLLQGQLTIDRRDDRVPFTALALRRNQPDDTIACRFVDLDATLCDALDRAVARRLAPRRAGLAGLAGALLLALSAAPGVAAGSSGTSVLVPGGFTLPEFRLNFPDMLSATSSNDLEISLTSPDKSVLQFLFSPRSQFGFVTDPGTGTSRSYLGLSWNLFENSGFFGNFGLAGSLTRPGAEETNRRGLGPPLAVHGTVEFGYQIGYQHSLSLSLDHASAPDLFEHGDYNNFRLRYGLKF